MVIILGLTHSSLFECKLDFQSFHHLLYSYSFNYFILLILLFLIYFGLYNVGSPLAFLYIYHPPPISVISFWNFFSSKCFNNSCRYLLEHLFRSSDICYMFSVIILFQQFKTYINKIKNSTQCL